MKLSMQIFADWFEEYHPKKEIKNNNFEIETVRLFSGNMSLNTNTLYIGRFCDFFVMGSRNIICAHNNDMLILQTEDLEEVLDRALDALEFYASWNDRMLKCLSKDAMLQDLLDASEGLLKYPIFFVDAGQRLLAYTRKFYIGSVDKDWDEMVANGSMNMDVLVSLNQKYPEIIERKGLYYNKITDIFPYGSYIYNVHIDHNWVSSMIMIENEGTFTEGERDCFLLLCEYMRNWFENHIEEQRYVIIDNLLQMTITNVEGSEANLKRKLQLLGWKPTDPLVFFKLDALYQPFVIHRHLCRSLNHYLPESFALITDASICILCNLRNEKLEVRKERLYPLLQNSKYYGVFGQIFTLEDSVYLNYKYTESISEHCEKMVGRIYNGEQYVLPYILAQMKETIIADVTHPIIKKLKKYDEKHHSQMYETLCVYLKKERSPLAAAAELGIHRNSFSYRLKKLEELLEDTNLNDPLVRLHLLISIELDT